ncbi:ficolin-2-like isoform X3 [Mytilus californianus]|uniref:ficolin-2-like isoform X3 n=1 Tax=Mytilus californianus TaxID=6549 RepID=UPI00224596D5|nr:ficolin-2-like isoform X3 [Mytilus californianus]
MQILLGCLFLSFFSITKGDYLRMLQKLESKLDDNTENLQEILSRLPNGICAKDNFKRPSKCQEGRPIDCNEIPGKCPSGVYKVFPKHTKGIDVYCEMNLDEGHWTVFQRRENGYTDFYRGWNDYKSGFGNPKHEFWLGNSLEHHNGQRFSTKDSDNDNNPSHCATYYSGAWWFNTCVTSNLNGQYFLKTPKGYHQGVYWRSWKGYNYSLKGSLMMMRRVSI